MPIDTIERILYADPGHSLIVHPNAGEDKEDFFQFILTFFENTNIEQDAEGNVHIMAPTGGESSDQNAEITAQLRTWSKQDGRGRSFDSSVLFIMPDDSKLSPDASWVSNERLKVFTKSQRRKFLPLVPEFVIELKSPTDRVSDLEKKMEAWRNYGVAVGWLINPDERWVKIYQVDRTYVENRINPSEVAAIPPIAGFVLDLKPIWAGLDLD